MRTDRLTIAAILIGIFIWIYLLVEWNPWSRASKEETRYAKPLLQASQERSTDPSEVWIEIEDMDDKTYRRGITVVRPVTNQQRKAEPNGHQVTVQVGGPKEAKPLQRNRQGLPATRSRKAPKPVRKKSAPRKPANEHGQFSEKALTQRNTHTVKKGETLSFIARKYLGSPGKWRMIMEANPKIRDPRKIRIGTMLVIPTDSATRQASRSAQQLQAARLSPVNSRDIERIYVIAKGDNLDRISRRFYGTSQNWKKIANANSTILRNPNVIQPGMRIVIP